MNSPSAYEILQKIAANISRVMQGQAGPTRKLLAALASGENRLAIAVRADPGLVQACLDDATGDRLDALLCLVQAAWAWQRRDQAYGLPARVDPLEGWIVSVPADGEAG